MISIEEARSIRWEVLKPDRPASEVAYQGDDSELAELVPADPYGLPPRKNVLRC
jgi:hypothetical protein